MHGEFLWFWWRGGGKVEKGQQEVYFWHFFSFSNKFLFVSLSIFPFPFSFHFFFLVFLFLICYPVFLQFSFFSYFTASFPVYLFFFSTFLLFSFFSIFEFLSMFQPMRRLSYSWPTVECTGSWRPSTTASPWSAFLSSSIRWARENMVLVVKTHIRVVRKIPRELCGFFSARRT